MAGRATLIDHRRDAAVWGEFMFAIFGLVVYVAIGLAWLVFAMFRLMVWLMVVLISAASSAITRSPRRRTPQLTVPGRRSRPGGPGRPALTPAPRHGPPPMMAVWARGHGGQAFHDVADSLASLRHQLLLPRPAGHDDLVAYWQRVLNLATILESMVNVAMTDAPQMPDAGAQSQWNMALDHAQHGAADLRGAVTGKGSVGYGVAVSELETATRYIGRMISHVPRSR
jgi:hypothetical protein